MKTLSVYENLDTSFVNLSALLRYLRGRRFAGAVRVELGDYEADITFGENGLINVREHDRRAGRIAEGDEALQRILIRARESGGSIHVFRLAAEPETVADEIQAAAPKTCENSFIKNVKEKNSLQIARTDGAAKNFAENGLREPTKKINLPEKTKIPNSLPPKNEFPAASPNAPQPLEFSNRVEERARRSQISDADWQKLLELTGELLGAVEEVLAAANLDFNAALTKVRAEIAADYPFLNPPAGVFDYAAGQVTMHDRVNAKIFVAGINECLRRILDRLGANPRFDETYRAAVQKILALIRRRESLYAKFFITPQLEKIVGV